MLTPDQPIGFRPSARRLLACGAALACSLGLSGCGSMMMNATEAQVRFADLSADAPALDVYLNTTGAAYNLSYATYSSYVPVPAGSYQFSANRANTGQALANGHAALVSGHQYTAVVSHHLGDLQEHVYADNVPPPVVGTLAVRVLHEAGGGPLDVYLVPGGASPGTSPAGVQMVATNLSTGGSAGYVRVPAGSNYGVYAVAAGGSLLSARAVRLSGASLNGAAGGARTLILAEPAGESKGLYGLMLDDAEAP